MISSPFFGDPYFRKNLGNQLFELASLLGLARRYHTSLYISDAWQYISFFKLSSFIQFQRLKTFITIKEPRFQCCLEFFDRLAPIIENECVTLEGYLQSEKYWKPVEEEIRDIFAFEDSLLQPAKMFLDTNRIDTDRFVAISVRRGDFETDPNHYLLPIEYYKGAVEKYFPEKDLIVFSDDLDWCKANFQYNDRRIVITENKTAIEQLCLLSLFKYYIIANSTFSWWGAYLSGDKQKVVVRPYHHFDGELKEREDVKDHYPEEWIEFNYEQSQMMRNPMPVYAVNLARRTERYLHITHEFAGKPEFDLTVVPAIEHQTGAYGLWKTIQKIVEIEARKKSDYFILCEDDHTFTRQYSPEFLFQSIGQAEALGADLLSGGYSWFENALQISEHLFWVHKFTGMQFTVIFRKFYRAILDADFGEEVITDISLSGITDNKLVIYPYISTQKEFGYSDVTSKNNFDGFVESIFVKAMEQLDILNKVKQYYSGSHR